MATIRVKSGCHVTYFDGQRYELGKTDVGIRLAMLQALQLRRENRPTRELGVLSRPESQQADFSNPI